MNTQIALLLLFGLASLATSASAQVFKCKQSSGLVVYSDKPCEFAPHTTDVRLITAVDDPASFVKPAPDPKKPPTTEAQKDEVKPGTIATGANAAGSLRAMGPDQALDSQGRVYKRVSGGYLDSRGTFVPGVARGHR
jgi:hypothetical protein